MAPLTLAKHMLFDELVAPGSNVVDAHPGAIVLIPIFGLKLLLFKEARRLYHQAFAHSGIDHAGAFQNLQVVLGQRGQHFCHGPAFAELFQSVSVLELEKHFI